MKPKKPNCIIMIGCENNWRTKMYEDKNNQLIDKMLAYLEALASKFSEFDAKLIFAIEIHGKRIMLLNNSQHNDFELVEAIIEATGFLDHPPLCSES